MTVIFSLFVVSNNANSQNYFNVQNQSSEREIEKAPQRPSANSLKIAKPRQNYLVVTPDDFCIDDLRGGDAGSINRSKSRACMDKEPKGRISEQDIVVEKIQEKQIEKDPSKRSLYHYYKKERKSEFKKMKKKNSAPIIKNNNSRTIEKTKKFYHRMND